MTPTKRKTQQDTVEPEDQENVGIASEKHKPEDELKNLEPKDQQPALTINIQSWATPIMGVVMLVIGALAGFYACPTVLGQLPKNTAEQNPVVAIPTEDRSKERQQLMGALVPKVRHFIGDSNAPVTIIEFGDFQ